MNTNMENSIVQLIDLPDELLLMIFKELNNVELLYSLMGINTRLDRILSGSMFTGTLTLLRYSSNCLVCPLFGTVVDRFCLQILPKIHYKINLLNLESLSMEHILLVADYPNLHSLGLYTVEEKTAERVFSDESRLFDTVNKKIQSLVIRITDNTKKTRGWHFVPSIFTNVLNVFNNLRYLNLHPFFEPDGPRLSFEDENSTFVYSTLLELHISVADLNDCLYLLDGRLNQLRIFYINISYLNSRPKMIENKKPLPNMKCFSLMSKTETFYYKESIVQLLQRMTNLEKLGLYIHVDQKTFIDGNNLKMDIINHLSRLKKFTFSIRSFIRAPDQTHLVSNEEIQHTLTNLGDKQIISYVDYFFKENSAQCHIYSYPYKLKYYDNVTNSFPGGLFRCVSEVSLFDDRPFEHEFFIRISEAFPMMKKLSIINLTPQNEKANGNSECLSLIEYPCLIELDFFDCNDDYLEQFLLNTKTYLLNNVCLYSNYESLARVTHYFTRVATQVNAAKINSLRSHDRFKSSKRLIEYFPHAKIS